MSVRMMAILASRTLKLLKNKRNDSIDNFECHENGKLMPNDKIVLSSINSTVDTAKWTHSDIIILYIRCISAYNIDSHVCEPNFESFLFHKVLCATSCNLQGTFIMTTTAGTMSI
jgi:hypothetical protein